MDNTYQNNNFKAKDKIIFDNYLLNTIIRIDYELYNNCNHEDILFILPYMDIILLCNMFLVFVNHLQNGNKDIAYDYVHIVFNTDVF